MLLTPWTHQKVVVFDDEEQGSTPNPLFQYPVTDEEENVDIDSPKCDICRTIETCVWQRRKVDACVALTCQKCNQCCSNDSHEPQKPNIRSWNSSTQFIFQKCCQERTMLASTDDIRASGYGLTLLSVSQTVPVCLSTTPSQPCQTDKCRHGHRCKS